MTDKYIAAIVTILVGIVGVAFLAVLVSKSSQTGSVLTAGSGGFATALCTALSPIGVKCGGGGFSPIPSVDSTITFPPAGTTTLPGFRGQ